METLTRFGKRWAIPAAAARLGRRMPADKAAYEAFLADLEPTFSEFIRAHPRCPRNVDLAALRYAIREFMEELLTRFSKERWAATYDPSRGATYCVWFLISVSYFLDRLDFGNLPSPPPADLDLQSITLVPLAEDGASAPQGDQPPDDLIVCAITNASTLLTECSESDARSKLARGGSSAVSPTRPTQTIAFSKPSISAEKIPDRPGRRWHSGPQRLPEF